MNIWAKYVGHVEKQLATFYTGYSAKEFIAMRTFGLVVGFTVGSIASVMNYMTYSNLATATVLGVGFSLIGFLAPNVQLNYTNKKHAKVLETELEETLLSIKERFDKENDIMKAIQSVASEKSKPMAHALHRICEENKGMENVEDVRIALQKRA